jgi:hypothetical protein
MGKRSTERALGVSHFRHVQDAKCRQEMEHHKPTPAELKARRRARDKALKMLRRSRDSRK